jgi:hypothetical protein
MEFHYPSAAQMDDRIMDDIELARQLAAASTCATRPAEWPQLKPLLRRLADRVERAETVLRKIAIDEGPLEEGERCPICGMKQHAPWCWYPALVEWDKWQAKCLKQNKKKV